MIDTIEKLKRDYLLGCIKVKSTHKFYLMPLAWWILDYKKYDPDHSDEKDLSFRNGIYTVSDTKITEYMNSINEDIIDIFDVQAIISIVSQQFPDENYSYLYFYIDFDKKSYVNGLYDIELENYLPDSTWTGKYDTPLNYLPEDLKDIWQDKLGVG